MEEKNKAIEEPKETWWKGPIKYIVAFFLIMILILWIFPSYGVKLDPNPKVIPKIDEVVPTEVVFINNTSLDRKENIARYVKPEDPIIKYIATKIASLSCGNSRICQAKAIYYFVRDNLDYIADPVGKEFVEHPLQTISSGGGDCESGSVVLASLEEAIGIDSQLVLIEGHAYVRILLPEALSRYKIKKGEDWIYLDWTCKRCEFGEIPPKNLRKKAYYVEVP